MSAAPTERHTGTRPPSGPAVTLSTLAEKKALGEPIAMVTAYDYPSAQVAEAAGVDVVLVGDSARHDRARLPEHRAGVGRRDADAAPPPPAAA